MAGILNTDGVTIKPITASPSNHGVSMSDATGGTDQGDNNGNALEDDNSVSVLLAESSAGDGTFVELYVTSTGMLLVNSS